MAMEEMTANFYDSGTDIEEYLKNYRSYLSLVRSMVADARADQARIGAFKDASARFGGELRASAFTEDWCGDWACNLPILRSFFAGAGVPFRVFDGERHGALGQRYRSEGADHIPVVSLWDGSGREIARWVEAPAAIQPLKAAWKERNPRLMELYAIKDGNQDAENEFARLYRKLLEDMAGWYRDGMWNETMDELTTLMKG